MNTTSAQPNLPGITPQALERFIETLRNTAPQPSADFQERLALRINNEATRRRGSFLKPLFRTPLRAAAAIVLTVAIVSGAVLAVSTFLRQALSYDAGLKAILDQGLGHEIGISQTIDDFTVTLDWAYADGNRLTLAYTIQGQSGVEYTNLTSDVYELRLRDNGTEIPFTKGMGALIDHNGDPVGWGAPSDIIPTSDRSLIISTYDLSSIDTGSRAMLDLQLEVEPYGVTLQQRTLLPIERFNDMKEGPGERFAFDFSIPLVNEVRVLNASQSATDQDITLTLRRITVTASQTRVVVCLVPPDPTRQWALIPYLATEGVEVPGGGSMDFITGVGEAAGESCNVFSYNAAMYDYQSQWSLEIRELVGFGSGGGNDQQRIAGSWRFDFVVP